MAKRFTKIRGEYGWLFILVGFFVGTAILSFILYKYLLVFIPENWSWHETYPRRSGTNSLRRILSLVLAIFTTISFLREYFELQRRLRKKPKPEEEQIAKPRTSISWRGFMFVLYGATLALWPASIFSREHFGVDFKDLGVLSFLVWVVLIFILVSIQKRIVFNRRRSST